MGKVAQPPITWRGAHPNNFTVGRPGASRDGRSTKHWIVGTLESARIVFNRADRYASSHFGVGGDASHKTPWGTIAAPIDQYVDINNTAWTDGNWQSNLRSITVEHEGGPNHALTNAMYEAAAWLHAWLMENYGVTYSVKHRDVSLKATQCPGTLDVARIEQRAKEIIAWYNRPPALPEWQANRKPIAAVTYYSQKDGLRLVDLTKPTQPADSRVFAINQDFLIGGYTMVGGVKYLITKSSMDLNKPNGIRESELARTPWVPPVVTPPKPETPDWADSVVDITNRTMYIIRDTLLIDLENGRPVVGKDGNEVRYKAGDVIENVSAQTIVGEETYMLTEYSYGEIKKGAWKNANGIKQDDLSMDPASTPPGTPANPDPVDVNWLRAALNGLIEAIKAILSKLPGGK